MCKGLKDQYIIERKIPWGVHIGDTKSDYCISMLLSHASFWGIDITETAFQSALCLSYQHVSKHNTLSTFNHGVDIVGLSEAYVHCTMLGSRTCTMCQPGYMTKACSGNSDSCTSCICNFEYRISGYEITTSLTANGTHDVSNLYIWGMQLFCQQYVVIAR